MLPPLPNGIYDTTGIYFPVRVHVPVPSVTVHPKWLDVTFDTRTVRHSSAIELISSLRGSYLSIFTSIALSRLL